MDNPFMKNCTALSIKGYSDRLLIVMDDEVGTAFFCFDLASRRVYFNYIHSLRKFAHDENVFYHIENINSAIESYRDLEYTYEENK